MTGKSCASRPPQYQAACYRARHRKVPKSALEAEKKAKVVVKKGGKSTKKTGGKFKIGISWSSIKGKLGSAWKNVKSTLSKGGKAVSSWWKNIRVKMHIKGKKAESWWKKEQARVKAGLKLKGKAATAFWAKLKAEFKAYIKKMSTKTKKTIKVKVIKHVTGKVTRHIHVPASVLKAVSLLNVLKVPMGDYYTRNRHAEDTLIRLARLRDAYVVQGSKVDLQVAQLVKDAQVYAHRLEVASKAAKATSSARFASTPFVFMSSIIVKTF